MQQLRTVLQKNLVSKGPFALDGENKILFADMPSLAMLTWVLLRGSASSVFLEKHVMTFPLGDYISNTVSPLVDFWMAPGCEVPRGQQFKVDVEIHKIRTWNLQDLHAQRCNMRVEGDLSYLDAEVAQAKANLEMLENQRTSVLMLLSLCFFMKALCLLVRKPKFFSHRLLTRKSLATKKSAVDADLKEKVLTPEPKKQGVIRDAEAVSPEPKKQDLIHPEVHPSQRVLVPCQTPKKMIESPDVTPESKKQKLAQSPDSF